jgi:hypothetical protein
MVEQLKVYPQREPSQPFCIVSTSGMAYEVQSPYFVAIAESYLFHCVPQSDPSVHVRLNQIFAIETVLQAV